MTVVVGPGQDAADAAGLAAEPPLDPDAAGLEFQPIPGHMIMPEFIGDESHAAHLFSGRFPGWLVQNVHLLPRRIRRLVYERQVAVNRVAGHEAHPSVRVDGPDLDPVRGFYPAGQGDLVVPV